MYGPISCKIGLAPLVTWTGFVTLNMYNLMVIANGTFVYISRISEPGFRAIDCNNTTKYTNVQNPAKPRVYFANHLRQQFGKDHKAKQNAKQQNATECQR